MFQFVEQQNSSLQQRGGENILHYEIETEYALYMESRDGQYHSYTHYVMNTPERGGLENIVFSSNGERYTTYLVHYDMTEEQISRKALGENVDINGIEVTYYTFNENTAALEVADNGCLFYVDETACCSGGNYANGILDGEHCPGYTL